MFTPFNPAGFDNENSFVSSLNLLVSYCNLQSNKLSHFQFHYYIIYVVL